MSTRSFSSFFFTTILCLCLIGCIGARPISFEEFLRCANIALPRSSALTINVLNSGAKGDGITDDSKAFSQAWKQACSSSHEVNLVIPNKVFLLKPVTFSGPCKSKITIQLSGDIVASEKTSDYSSSPTHWLTFNGVTNLVIEGGGTIDGRGSIWWKNSCKVDKSKPCKNAPTALTFESCTNLVVRKIKVINSQQIHLTFNSCRNVVASGLTVTAPSTSPNTDGVHISRSRNVTISSTTIATGDDCISIVTGSTTIHATGITCGPGHGISIGSLGEKGSPALVQNVVVDGANFTGSTNGVRIKTWEGGSGSASNIIFRNIHMHNVANPIIIDQDYCDHAVQSCSQSQGAVLIQNVLYENIFGTSASKNAITFECATKSSCKEIQLHNIHLTSQNGGKSSASCINVHTQNTAPVSPSCPAASLFSDLEFLIETL